MFTKENYCYGVGLNYRNEIKNDLITNIKDLDFIEVNTERFFSKDYSPYLELIINQIPVSLHGLTLSLGTDEAISPEYIDNLSGTLKKINCLWFSEHIAVTQVQGIEIRSLMPISFTYENMEKMCSKIKTISALSNKNFLLENIAYYYTMPPNEMNEVRYIKELVEKADCGILLDLNNLYVNSINHQYDPYDFLNQLPLERVVEIHLAGCNYINNMLIDTHASSVKKEVLELLDFVCKRTLINGVIIERDAKLDNFNELLDEVKIVRNILQVNN